MISHWALGKQGIGQTGQTGHWPNRALAKQGIGQTGHWANRALGIGHWSLGIGHWALGILPAREVEGWALGKQGIGH